MAFNLADGEKVLGQGQWLNGQLTVTTNRLMLGWFEGNFNRFGRPTLGARIADARGRQYLPLEMIDSVKVRTGRDSGFLRYSLSRLSGSLVLLLFSLVLLIVVPVLGLIVLPLGLWTLYRAGRLLYWFWTTRYTTIALQAGDRGIDLYSFHPADAPEIEELLDTVEAARQSLLSETPSKDLPPEPVQVMLNP